VVIECPCANIAGLGLFLRNLDAKLDFAVLTNPVYYANRFFLSVAYKTQLFLYPFYFIAFKAVVWWT
jgi:hypothetical protein